MNPREGGKTTFRVSNYPQMESQPQDDADARFRVLTPFLEKHV
jgi:hypothetical protein